MTGEDFRRAREARGLTMREASRVCGFSGEVGLLSGIESGEITKTTSKCVALICDAYGVARADAFGLIAHWSPGMRLSKYLASEEAGKRRSEREIEKLNRERTKKEREMREREARAAGFARTGGEPMRLQAVNLDYLREIINARYDGSALRFAKAAGMAKPSVQRIISGEARKLSYKNAVLIAAMQCVDAEKFWERGRTE